MCSDHFRGTVETSNIHKVYAAIIWLKYCGNGVKYYSLINHKGYASCWAKNWVPLLLNTYGIWPLVY